MKVILAQGNPGAAYSQTRHNIGFNALDYMAALHNAHWLEKPKFKAYIANLTLGQKKAILVKPITYYNQTGMAAQAILNFYKLNPAQSFMVVHDDLALNFGKIRIRHQGSDAGNNGIKSLNAHLGQNYTRVRIGTANSYAKNQQDTAFVLGHFTDQEKAFIKESILPTTTQIMTNFCQDNLKTTSYNLIKKEEDKEGKGGEGDAAVPAVT